MHGSVHGPFLWGSYWWAHPWLAVRALSKFLVCASVRMRGNTHIALFEGSACVHRYMMMIQSILNTSPVSWRIRSILDLSTPQDYIHIIFHSYLIKILNVLAQICEVYKLKLLIWQEWKLNRENRIPELDVMRYDPFEAAPLCWSCWNYRNTVVLWSRALLLQITFSWVQISTDWREHFNQTTDMFTFGCFQLTHWIYI